ncbi:MAG TPA: arsenate reductase ArsC [Terriglobia bacterium]|nr:arsenate reductase ArsC [Terriglobia bacterium]
MKPKVLFLCTENSCRSQMAEGLLRRMAGDEFDVFSAGAVPTKLNPAAVEAMREAGIDISAQYSKPVTQFVGESFRYAIRVCDQARETCPVIPGAIQYLDWSFEDPAKAEGTPAERMAVFRRVRDDIRGHILDLLARQS